MPADANDRPAAKEPEAEVLDFEVVDDGRGISHAGGGGSGEPAISPEDFVAMAPQMLKQAIRDALKEKFKDWFVRNLIATTVAVVFWEHTPVRVLFYIWAFFNGINLAFLVFGWFAGHRQAAKMAQIFGGLGGGLHGRVRDE